MNESLISVAPPEPLALQREKVCASSKNESMLIE